MPDVEMPLDAAQQRRRALSRWDDEGGAKPSAAHAVRAVAPDIINAVLAEGSDRQLQVARYISPRPELTHHPVTIQAADHMTDVVERALHFRTVHPS